MAIQVHTDNERSPGRRQQHSDDDPSHLDDAKAMLEKHNAEMTEALKTEKENVMFGTLECWLLFKLSGDKKLHFSTYSNAAATGI